MQQKSILFRKVPHFLDFTKFLLYLFGQKLELIFLHLQWEILTMFCIEILLEINLGDSNLSKNVINEFEFILQLEKIKIYCPKNCQRSPF